MQTSFITKINDNCFFQSCIGKLRNVGLRSSTKCLLTTPTTCLKTLNEEVAEGVNSALKFKICCNNHLHFILFIAMSESH